MTRAAIEFDSLSNTILAAGSEADPSQLHGFVCGVLAAGTTPDKKRWQKELETLLELEAIPVDLIRDFLQLALESQQQLSDNNFGFHLLLSEDEDIHARILALSHWCQGFLHGFGVGGYKGELQPTSKEALQDISAIAQVDANCTEQTEEAESQLLELQEYVRVAVLTIFTEVRGKEAAPGHTVH